MVDHGAWCSAADIAAATAAESMRLWDRGRVTNSHDTVCGLCTIGITRHKRTSRVWNTVAPHMVSHSAPLPLPTRLESWFVPAQWSRRCNTQSWLQRVLRQGPIHIGRLKIIVRSNSIELLATNYFTYNIHSSMERERAARVRV
jgi:hypothetical protein